MNFFPNLGANIGAFSFFGAWTLRCLFQGLFRECRHWSRYLANPDLTSKGTILSVGMKADSNEWCFGGCDQVAGEKKQTNMEESKEILGI